MKYMSTMSHDVAVLHCKQHQHLHHTYSLSHTFCLSLSVSEQYANKETSDTQTGSKTLPQTCKAKLIKGPLWLWWRRVRFPLTLHTAPLHKYLQAADWTRKEKKRVPVWLRLDPRWRNVLMETFCWSIWTRRVLHIMPVSWCIAESVFFFSFSAVWDACTKTSTTSLNMIQEVLTGSLQLPSFTSSAAFSPTA